MFVKSYFCIKLFYAIQYGAIRKKRVESTNDVYQVIKTKVTTDFETIGVYDMDYIIKNTTNKEGKYEFVFEED